MPLLERSDCVLVVIDMQVDFYGPLRVDVNRAEFARVAARCAWVAGAAAELGVPIVVTEEGAAYNGRTVDAVLAALPDGTPILPKGVFAAPDNPGILAAVEATGRSTVVLVGLETDVCVAQSALRFHAGGMRVAAVHDALFSPGQAHANGLARMTQAGIELLSAKELVYDWVRSVEGIQSLKRARPDLASPPGFSL